MKKRKTAYFRLSWAGSTGALCLLLAVFLAACLGGAEVCAASGNITVHVSNIQAGDRLFFYETASHSQDGGAWNWNPKIVSWMKEEEEIYKKLLAKGPGIVEQMGQEELANLAQRMIMGLMPEASGGFVLELAGQVRADGESVSITLPAGYYLLVIAGTECVYVPVVFGGEQNTQTIAIPEGMRSAPVLEKTIRQQGTLEVSGQSGITAAGGDRLAVELHLKQTDYPAVYAPLKNTCSILEVWDDGLELIPSEFSIKGKDEAVLTLDEDYTLQHITDATLYSISTVPEKGGLAFYEKDGWFYLMDGSVAGSSRQQALAEYNKLWGAAYTQAELTERKNGSLLSVNLTRWQEELHLSYLLHMGNAYQPEGIYRAITQFAYSVNPVDAQMAGESAAEVRAESFCVKASLADGDTWDTGQPDGGKNVVYLAGGVFEVLEYADELTGAPDKETIEQKVSALGGGSYRVIWTEGGQTARIYLKTGQFSTDESGIGGIGGLRRKEYLLVQVMYPEGYALSRTGLIVEPDTDWPQTGESITRIVDTLWKNYRSVMLPESGGFGTGGYTMSGMVVLILAVVLLWRRYGMGKGKKFDRSSTKVRKMFGEEQGL